MCADVGRRFSIGHLLVALLPPSNPVSSPFFLFLPIFMVSRTTRSTGAGYFGTKTGGAMKVGGKER